MSRLGKRPVVLPKGVAAKWDGESLRVKGPKGELSSIIGAIRYRAVKVNLSDGEITVTRHEQTRQARMEQGLVRSLVQNMVTGVTKGFSRALEIVGVGYRADVKGRSLNLGLGYSHPVEFRMPEGIQISVDKQTRIVVSGADRYLVGETAAKIRRLRPPEPYKGKGIRFVDEHVRRKVGKAAATGTAGG